MKILVINTAGMTAQLALQAGNLNYFSELDASMKHSENLLPEIEKLLEEMGKSPSTRAEQLSIKEFIFLSNKL